MIEICSVRNGPCHRLFALVRRIRDIGCWSSDRLGVPGRIERRAPFRLGGTHLESRSALIRQLR